MRIIVDTNVLWSKAALAELENAPVDLIVPAVVFAERARQYRKGGRTTQSLRADLARVGFQIESFTAEHAERRAALVEDDRVWKAHARDAMVAGHVGDDDVLFTNNTRAFLLIGVPPINLRQSS